MRKRLYLSVADKKLAGVCGGLAEYFDIDATLVRVGFVLLTIVFAGLGGVLAYLLMWAIIPQQNYLP